MRMQAHDCQPTVLDISCLESFNSDNPLLENFGWRRTLPLPANAFLHSSLWTIVIHPSRKSLPGHIIACAKYFRIVKDSAKFPDKGFPVEISRNGESRWVYGVLKVETDQTSWECNAWRLVELSIVTTRKSTTAIHLKRRDGSYVTARVQLRVADTNAEDDRSHGCRKGMSTTDTISRLELFLQKLLAEVSNIQHVPQS
jgi:hypothetical protein